MSRLFVLFLLLIAFAGGLALRPKLARLFAQKNEQITARACQFGTRSDQHFDLVMLGDSLTDHGRWSELLPGYRIANRGIGRETIQNITARVHCIPEGPVYLMVGANDLMRDHNLTRIFADYRALFDGLSGRRVTVQSVLGPSGEKTDKLNANLRTLAAQFDMRFLDLRPALGNPLHSSYDGVHLNEPAYLDWAKALSADLGTGWTVSQPPAKAPDQ